MNAIDTIYSLDVVKDLPDDELYHRLFESWNLTNGKIEVWGELELIPHRNLAKLFQIKTLSENREISYPLNVRSNIESGVYVQLGYANTLLNGQPKAWIKCELELSSPIERERHNNPFVLLVKKGTAQRLISMPHLNKNDILEGEVESFITEAVHDFHLAMVSKKITEEQNSIELEFQQNISNLTDELNNTEVKRDHAKSTLDNLTLDGTNLEVRKTQLESDIQNQKDELENLNHQYTKVELEMAKKIEKLKSYITEKALFLKDFEFIDEDDFDSFIFNVEKKENFEHTISFEEVLEGDYYKAVSYIQAYLKEQHILYPRHIIENYLTLIRSNDLVILAGDSGSGKTNLVQSFAKAVGGVSKIIPVKPNWTSSEDLLGYYNPLEKKYLSTSFLDALIEAQQHPDIPYFICLDEMNLARVEYYFADFLSKLETRDTKPEIQLYSDDESAHVLSELKAIVSIITDAKAKYSKEGIVDFVKLMQDEEVNLEMKRAFGFSDKDSLIKYHGDIRRMLSGIISTPSTITVPANVRIIGAINIDETTHYLSPKILDRAHIMKFKSPLLTDWGEIFAEIESYDFEDVSKPLHFNIDALGIRQSYPKFDREDSFVELFIRLNKEFFSPLGVEFGMRTIRQGLNYLELYKELNDSEDYAINNFMLHKVFPKFNFDGNKQSGNYNKLELLEKVLLPRIEAIVPANESLADEFSSVAALKEIITNAKANDGIVNYWS